MNKKRIARQKERAVKAVQGQAIKLIPADKPPPKVNQLPRLAAIRAELGHTQETVAQLLNTTQQAVARWEKGTTEPTLAQLRDLAMIFGCSVADLMGRNLPIPIASTWLYRERKLTSPLWGCIGIRLPGADTAKWYPIMEAEYFWVISRLEDITEEEPWIVVTTLCNRELVLNINNLQQVSFLAMHADPPDGDDDMGDYQRGYPFEFFVALHHLATDVGDEAYEASDKLRQLVEEFLEEYEADPDNPPIFEFLHNTRVYLSDGSMFSYWADDPGALSNFAAFAMTTPEWGPSMEGRMVTFGNDEWSAFVLPNRIAMIEIPLLDLKQAEQDERDELAIYC